MRIHIHSRRRQGVAQFALLLLAILLTTGTLDLTLVYAQTPTPQTSGAQAVVTAARLNVRSGPGQNTTIVGVLGRGTQVRMLKREGEWAQIDFPAAPGGRGWVSARYLTLGNGPAPATPTAVATGVPAPKTVGFQGSTFRWQWPGIHPMGNKDWYFDIQIFRATAQDPYKVIVAEPANVTLANGIYSFRKAFTVDCGTYWVVQIATRVNGKFAGWISPRSGRLTLGPACTDLNDHKSSTPEPTPCSQNCPG